MRGATPPLHPFVGWRGIVSGFTVALLLPAGLAFAQGAEWSLENAHLIDPSSVTAFSITLGAVFFGLLASLLLMREKRAAAEAMAASNQLTGELRAKVSRTEALLAATGDVSLVWQRRAVETRPVLIGDLTLLDGAPATKNGFLDFASWCPDHVADRLNDAILNLRQNGESFAITCVPSGGGQFEAVGRTAAGQSVVRFHNVSEERLAFIEMEEAHSALRAEANALKSLLNSVPHPAWLHSASGALLFANRRYLDMAGAEDIDTARTGDLAPFRRSDWQSITKARTEKGVFSGRFEQSHQDKTFVFEAIDRLAGSLFAGLATDITDRIAAEKDLQSAVKNHGQTLDQLPTPVAIFGGDKRLRYHNSAYRELFGLDDAFLAMRPEDGAILDRLRAERKLPEQASFRDWRADVLATYSGKTPRELWWYLPNGKTLRIVADRHPGGGLTYIYENVTDRIDLETRVKSLLKVQRETLDSLTEGVAVFGVDGRLRLSNPAFRTIWPLKDWTEDGTPHVRDVIAECRLRHDDEALWGGLLAAATDFSEHREPLAGRLTRADDMTLDYAIVPLPDGSVMVTFDNVTDKIAVERMLTERNRALETADELKSAFIQLVSYELREPLTSIIGFAQVLKDGSIGALNERQSEYAGHIADQSDILHALIDNILDLATVDAGIIELSKTEVDAADAVDQAVTVVSERLAAKNLRLEKQVEGNLGTFPADKKRIVQILFNLLVHAIDATPDGGAVIVAASADAASLSLSVADSGPAIPRDRLQHVFDRFGATQPGSPQKGGGLGLAIVKSFVELHDGRIEIESLEGEGTTITCTFSKSSRKAISAA